MIELNPPSKCVITGLSFGIGRRSLGGVYCFGRPARLELTFWLAALHTGALNDAAPR